jgi:hypothetical protein
MRKLLITLTLVSLVLPASALAGGWATAGLSAPPDNIAAGDQWNAQITVLQHGETPLEGVSPTLTIKHGDTVKTFTATATDKPGVYAASVVFPSTGRWSYEVYDGFTQYGGAQTHTFGSVSVGVGGSDGLPYLAILGVGLLMIAAVAVIYFLTRRVRVRAPAPTH